jgi:hypothetical protein
MQQENGIIHILGVGSISIMDLPETMIIGAPIDCQLQRFRFITHTNSWSSQGGDWSDMLQALAPDTRIYYGMNDKSKQLYVSLEHDLPFYESLSKLAVDYSHHKPQCLPAMAQDAETLYLIKLMAVGVKEVKFSVFKKALLDYNKEILVSMMITGNQLRFCSPMVCDSIPLKSIQYSDDVVVEMPNPNSMRTLLAHHYNCITQNLWRTPYVLYLLNSIWNMELEDLVTEYIDIFPRLMLPFKHDPSEVQDSSTKAIHETCPTKKELPADPKIPMMSGKRIPRTEEEAMEMGEDCWLDFISNPTNSLQKEEVWVCKSPSVGKPDRSDSNELNDEEEEEEAWDDSSPIEESDDQTESEINYNTTNDEDSDENFVVEDFAQRDPEVYCYGGKEITKEEYEECKRLFAEQQKRNAEQSENLFSMSSTPANNEVPIDQSSLKQDSIETVTLAKTQDGVDKSTSTTSTDRLKQILNIPTTEPKLHPGVSWADVATEEFGTVDEELKNKAKQTKSKVPQMLRFSSKIKKKSFMEFCIESKDNSELLVAHELVSNRKFSEGYHKAKDLWRTSNWIEALQIMAFAQLKMDHFEQALELAQDVLKRHVEGGHCGTVDLSNLHLMFVHIYCSMNKKEEAMDHFRTLKTLGPTTEFVKSAELLLKRKKFM